tara:strand:- start:255 stop:506 length:252 start_codon:yes stop_codon:yes gene_type:complete
MNKILYFSAVWCGPCKALAPTMDQLSSQGLPVQKIDVDQDNNMSAQYGVRNVPTLIKVDSNGVEVGRLVGNQSADVIKEWYGN